MVENKREETGRKTDQDVGGWMIFFITCIVFSDFLDDFTVNISATNIKEFRCVEETASVV
jgi:hypothetical protein